MISRDLFNRRLRKVRTIIYLGAALFIGGIVAGKAFGKAQWFVATQWSLALGLIGFGMASIAMVYALHSAFPCPNCGCNLARLFMEGNRFRIDQRVKFCPYCGQDFDTGDNEAIMHEPPTS